MKYLSMLLLSVLAFPLLFQSEWKTYQSKDGKATIEMPDGAELTASDANSMYGPLTTEPYMVDLSAKDGDNLVMEFVSYTFTEQVLRRLENPREKREFHESLLENQARGLNGTIKEQRKIKLNGHTGREALISIEKGAYTLTIQYFQIKTQGYYAQILTKSSALENEERKKFLESFKIEAD